MRQQWQNSREVVKRVYIAGNLVLKTPAHFGNGDTGALTDIPLLRDSLDPSRPLLTGASIAGALRNYLREYELGYGRAESQNGSYRVERLFGYLEGYNAAVESWLMVDDALGVPPAEGAAIEIRDGVAIEPATRTAKIDEDGQGKKFDIELLAAGTTFPLHFELWLRKGEEGLLDDLVLALKGLEEGRIRLGMRKRRGYGECTVSGWRIQHFEMAQPQDILGWLNYEFPEIGSTPSYTETLPAMEAGEGQRKAFKMTATFRLKNSLLIRSGSGGADAVDMVHLRSWREGQQKPVLSGTSLAGVLRHRAFRIAKTLKGEGKAQDLINRMFGRRIQSAKDQPSGSRVLVTETIVENGIEDRIQARVKLDRFTGGAYPQALFSQQPIFAKKLEPTRLTIELTLIQFPQAKEFEAEVGLLLLLLKDLWTGDLPVGGESSVGRGVLHGETATLSHDGQTWEISQGPEGKLIFADPTKISQLEDCYLKALQEVK